MQQAMAGNPETMTMTFDQLGLSPEILRAIADQGYTEPTPIQAQAIPPILQGKDIMGGAQTGTGKTAGFTLPMLHRLQRHANTSVSPARHPIRALILVPTRELAAQVYESVQAYGKYVPLKCAAIYGGVNIDPQIKTLRAGVEILVATPGRLLDHVEQKTIQLSKIEILVLDEADRMLDMGFIPDIRRILAQIPSQRQSLMFSATFSDEIKKLADKLLKEPVLIEVARRNSITELVTHVVHPVDRERKRELLAHLIESQDLKQVLVFVRTKHGASRLALQLKRDGITATAIHGDKSQPQRMQALADFKEGAVRVLVATDVAARGLDIEDLSHVVNFELPTTPEDYIHRIGRTGRAGTRGDAISLVCEEERELLDGIQKLLKVKLDSHVVSGFEVGVHPAGEPTGARARPDRNAPGRPDRKKPAESRRHEGETHPAPGAKSPRKQETRKDKSPSRNGRASPPSDPLFTQPYTPPDTQSTSPGSSIPIDRNRHPNHLRRKQPVPALFMPRTAPEPTRDE
jgi:ATP-dependent RNA helicase RhlE